MREIYETAIEAEARYGLPDEDCKEVYLRSAAFALHHSKQVRFSQKDLM